MNVVALGEVSDLVTKGTTPTSIGLAYSDQGVPFVRVNNIKDGQIDLQNDVLFVDNEVHGKLRRSQILPNDLLLSIAGTIGRTAIVPNNAPDLNCNQAIAIIRTKPDIDINYLRHWLESSEASEQIQRSSVTATIANLSLGQIKNLKIPLPPLAEQKRIAAILDQADALRRLRRQSIDRLNTLTQSIFYEMFGDPIANPKGWPETYKLGEVSEIVSGITKGRKLNGQATREVPYLAVVNVQDKHLELEPLKTIDATEDEIKRYRLNKGDLLLTEGGDPDKLGRGTLWDNEVDECIHQNHVFRVRLQSNVIEPVYLNWIIGSSRGKSYFLRSAKQTTGIATINKTQLKAFPLLVPPSRLQKRFRDRVNRLAGLTCQFEVALRKMDVLFSSLQQRAFRGEL